MSYRVDNAIVMAAGVSSRFAPLSHEMPKALIPVRGEPLLERELRQLRDAGVPQIILVTGYKTIVLFLVNGWKLSKNILKNICQSKNNRKDRSITASVLFLCIQLFCDFYDFVD